MFRRTALALILLGLVAAIFGYASARQQPQIVRYQVVLPNWPAGQPPLRIVQLSDVHGNWQDMPPSRIDAIVAQVNALKPDLIVLTGDYVGGKLFDWPHIRLEHFTDSFAGLKSRYGSYAVLGNHDTKFWTRWAFARTHTHLLVNQWVDIGPVTLAGVDDVTNQANPATGAAVAVTGAPTDKPLILLGHEPDYFQYMPASVDLLIAGHTHGGQIKLPWIGARSLGPFLDAHLRGSFFEAGQRLIVSSGLGTSIVPMRIGVRPEIVEISISGTTPPS